MDLDDRLVELSNRIKKQKNITLTEEATKTAFVLPFLQALGYDVFNPLEVIPEFTADHGVKRGEKVDYAIKQNDDITIIIECKPVGAALASKHAGQLFRYFSVTDARFGVLTDGVKYLFFSDLEKENKMDERAFFEFDMLDFDEEQVEQLKKFSKSSFDIESIVATASDLKYNKALLAEFENEYTTPSDDLIRLFAARVYEGRMTSQVKDRFSELVGRSFTDFVRTKINDRLKSALDGGATPSKESKSTPPASPPSNLTATTVQPDDGIDTTVEEIESHMIVRAICAEITDPARIAMRDAKSYCAILFDDNNRKPLVRLYYMKTKMSIGIFIGKDEARHDIEKLTDIYQYRADILNAVKHHQQ